MAPRQAITLIPFLVIACLSSSQAGDPLVTQFSADRDNTLCETRDEPVADGLGETFFVGITSDALRHRGMLFFNVSSLPKYATIVEANLTLYINKSAAAETTSFVSVHRLTRTWGEGTSSSIGGKCGVVTPQSSTWDFTFYNVDLSLAKKWTSPGGDFYPDASSTALAEQAGSEVLLTGLESDVQGWFSNSSSMHGWIILGDEVDDGSSRKFASRQAPNKDHRPTLRILYTVPDKHNLPDGAKAIIVVACLAVTTAFAASLVQLSKRRRTRSQYSSIND